MFVGCAVKKLFKSECEASVIPKTFRRIKTVEIVGTLESIKKKIKSLTKTY